MLILQKQKMICFLVSVLKYYTDVYVYISHHFMHAAPKSQRDDDFLVDPTSEKMAGSSVFGLESWSGKKQQIRWMKHVTLGKNHVWLQFVVCCVTLRWFFMFLKKC